MFRSMIEKLTAVCGFIKVPPSQIGMISPHAIKKMYEDRVVFQAFAVEFRQID